MKGNIIYSFDNERPIYLQLAEQLRIEILSGKIAMGEKLPSVRDLALNAKVNPNTVQKSLAELEEEHLIVTERTNGKYVTTDQDIIDELRYKLVSEKIEEFLISMRQIGIDKKILIKFLKNGRR